MKKLSLIKNQLKNILIVSLVFLFCLILWEAVVVLLKISPIVLIQPSKIIPVITNDSQVILNQLSFSAVEIFVGWFSGSLIAIIMAAVIFAFKIFSRIVVSVCVVINAIPLIALSAIIGGFIGTNQDAKTIIVAILCFFPMLIVALSSFANANGDYKNLFKTYNASSWQRFIKLILPHSLPSIFTALKLNVVTAITTGIVSEFFGAHGGIGQFILSRKGFYDLPMVWAAIFFLIIAGASFYLFVGLIQKLIVNW